MQPAAYAGSEQAGNLINGVRKARRLPRLHHPSSCFVAHKALDHRPAEWTDVVDGGAAVARIPDHAHLRVERTLANDPEEKLFVASKGEAGRGVTPISRG
jgi:hypothetical protein